MVGASYTDEPVFDDRRARSTGAPPTRLGDRQMYSGTAVANGATTLTSRSIPTYPELRSRQVATSTSRDLYTRHCDPRADARRRGPPDKTQRQTRCGFGLGRRADQSRGVAADDRRGGEHRCPIVEKPPGGRPRPARIPISPRGPPRRSRVGDVAAAGRAMVVTPTATEPCMASATDPCMALQTRMVFATMSGSCRSSRRSKNCTSPARATGRPMGNLLDHRTRRRRDQCAWPPHGHGRGGERAARISEVAEAAWWGS